jgi:hypothetical protein
LTFNGLQGVIFQEAEIFTAVQFSVHYTWNANEFQSDEDSKTIRKMDLLNDKRSMA